MCGYNETMAIRMPIYCLQRGREVFAYNKQFNDRLRVRKNKIKITIIDSTNVYSFAHCKSVYEYVYVIHSIYIRAHDFIPNDVHKSLGLNQWIFISVKSRLYYCKFYNSNIMYEYGLVMQLFEISTKLIFIAWYVLNCIILFTLCVICIANIIL